MPATPSRKQFDTAAEAIRLQELRRNEQARQRTGRHLSCPLCANVRQEITDTATGQKHLYCPRCGDLETLPGSGTDGDQAPP